MIHRKNTRTRAPKVCTSRTTNRPSRPVSAKVNRTPRGRTPAIAPAAARRVAANVQRRKVSAPQARIPHQTPEVPRPPSRAPARRAPARASRSSPTIPPAAARNRPSTPRARGISSAAKARPSHPAVRSPAPPRLTSLAPRATRRASPAATASRGKVSAIRRPAATREICWNPPTPGAAAGAGEDPNLEFARKQTDLALEYLRDQMAKDKSSLLEQLGWSREDAEGFLRRWDEMKRAAGQQGPAGDTARKSARRGHQEPGPAPGNARAAQRGRPRRTRSTAATMPRAASRRPTRAETFPQLSSRRGHRRPLSGPLAARPRR